MSTCCSPEWSWYPGHQGKPAQPKSPTVGARCTIWTQPKDNDDNDNNNEDENDDDNRLSLNITLTLHQPVTFLWWHCSYHTWETHPVPRHALCPPGGKGVTIWNNSMFWLLKYINLKIKTFVMCTFNFYIDFGSKTNLEEKFLCDPFHPVFVDVERLQTDKM